MKIKINVGNNPALCWVNRIYPNQTRPTLWTSQVGIVLFKDNLLDSI